MWSLVQLACEIIHCMVRKDDYDFQIPQEAISKQLESTVLGETIT